MSIKRSKGNCASEISLLPLTHRVLVVIEMLLCEAEVHDVHVLVIFRKHKVRLKR